MIYGLINSNPKIIDSMPFRKSLSLWVFEMGLFNVNDKCCAADREHGILSKVMYRKIRRKIVTVLIDLFYSWRRLSIWEKSFSVTVFVPKNLRNSSV